MEPSMTRTTTHPSMSMTRPAFAWQPSALLPDDGGQGGHQDGGQGATGAADSGTGTQDTGQTGTGAQTGQQSQDKTFTQADLDRIIGERLANAEKTWKQKLEEAQATAGKSEVEALRIKLEQAESRNSEVTKTAAERITAAEAKSVALALGTKPDRVSALIKHADLTAAVSEDGTVDDGKVKAAIEKALTDFPEWKATATTTTTASGGDLRSGSGSTKPTFTREQIESMPQDELIKRIDEINEAYAEGRVSG